MEEEEEEKQAKLPKDDSSLQSKKSKSDGAARIFYCKIGAALGLVLVSTGITIALMAVAGGQIKANKPEASPPNIPVPSWSSWNDVTGCTGYPRYERRLSRECRISSGDGEKLPRPVWRCGGERIGNETTSIEWKIARCESTGTTFTPRHIEPYNKSLYGVCPRIYSNLTYNNA